MNISLVNSINLPKNEFKNYRQNENKVENPYGGFGYTKHPSAFGKSFLVAFGARVDKGLDRFLEANADVMPKTVADYIKNLPDSANKTPIEAHRESFSMLELAASVDEIKEVFPDEPLFQNLISTSDSKARVGLIHDINVMSDVFDETAESAVKTGEDLTVYLVKKVFLENKSLPEINEDLDKDLDDVFRKEDKKYVGYSTLDALGIKYPDKSYLTSLRYTQEGYSDKMGEKLSQSLLEFYKNLTPEQRTERNAKSLKNIEQWWSELSDADKKSLLEEKEAEVAFLKLYEKSKKNTSSSKPKENDSNKADRTDNSTATPRLEKLNTPLSQDAMFIKLAALNLEAYRASLTPEELAKISEKKSSKMIDMWSSFTPQEKTDYISKMFIGSEKQQFAMIDAWNNSNDIREDLSSFLKSKNLYRPEGLIYRSQEYSEAQSKVMKEFWETYPEHAIKLGEAIRTSYEKVSKAYENGSFKTLQEEILTAQHLAKQEIKNKKSNNSKSPAFLEFYKVYSQAYSFLPKDFIKAYMKDSEVLDDKVLSEWTKALKGEIKHVSPESMAKIEAYKGTIFPERAAICQAMGEVMYSATGTHDVYSLNYSQLLLVINAASQTKQKPFSIDLTYKGKTRTITIKKDVNLDRITKLYEEYRRPLAVNDLKTVMNVLNIKKDNPLYYKAIDYINKYGSLAKKVFLADENIDMVAAIQIQNNFFEQVSDLELGQLFLDATTNARVTQGVQSMTNKYPFIPKKYAERKVQDTIVRVIDPADKNYEKVMDSNVADEHLAFVLRCALYTATNDDTVFDYDLDTCIAALSDFYKGNKKTGDCVKAGGPKTLYKPDFVNIVELYDMLSAKNDFPSSMLDSSLFTLPYDIADSFPEESKMFVKEVTKEFNKKYYNIIIYLNVLGLSRDRKDEILLELFNDYIQHSQKVTEYFVNNTSESGLS